MKKILFITLLVCFAIAMGWSQEVPNPGMNASIFFTDSFAFTGVSFEVFLDKLGIGASCGFMALGADSTMVIFLEPGAFIHFYFAGPQGSLYLGAMASYFTLFGSTGGSFQGAEAGLINLNGMVGFSAMFGNKKEFRFNIEVGPRYTMPTASGTTVSGFLFMHFLIGFGMNF